MLLLLLSLLSADEKPVPVVPLRHAHAHNDYLHTRPLLNALDHGFCSFEADVFLVDGTLRLGHYGPDRCADRTLEKQYLAPLWKRAREQGGRIYRDGPPVFLLVDLKSEAEPTYRALDALLAKYADLCTTVREGKVTPGAVTVVVSGNCPRETIAGQKVRHAAIDGRPPDLKSDAPAHLVPYLSDRWGTQFRWNGAGPMPEEERTRLRDWVKLAHAKGRLVRFWATPEREEVWKELRRRCGLDQHRPPRRPSAVPAARGRITPSLTAGRTDRCPTNRRASVSSARPTWT